MPSTVLGVRLKGTQDRGGPTRAPSLVGERNRDPGDRRLAGSCGRAGVGGVVEPAHPGGHHRPFMRGEESPAPGHRASPFPSLGLCFTLFEPRALELLLSASGSYDRI